MGVNSGSGVFVGLVGAGDIDCLLSREFNVELESAEFVGDRFGDQVGVGETDIIGICEGAAVLPIFDEGLLRADTDASAMERDGDSAGEMVLDDVGIGVGVGEAIHFKTEERRTGFGGP